MDKKIIVGNEAVNMMDEIIKMGIPELRPKVVIQDLANPNRGISRTPASTKLGRQIAAHNPGHIEHVGLTAEQKAWNAQIEAKRLVKQMRKNRG